MFGQCPDEFGYIAPASTCVTVALLTGRVPPSAACRHVAKHSEFVKGL